MNRLPLLMALSGAAVGLFGLTASALGQNALGDGTRLDRPLQRSGVPYNAPRPDFAEGVRLRNAIVTGNAPDGLSFRGDVGYRAPGEFSGLLGSNDLFSFRRDSLYSGLAGQGIRGTEALQYQFALSQGNRPGGSILTAPVMRGGAGVNAAAIVNPVPENRIDTDGAVGAMVSRPASTMVDPDQRGLNLWTLRSPSAFVATRGLDPTIMGSAQDATGGPMALTASPLTGLRMEPLGRTPDPLFNPQDAPLPRPGTDEETPARPDAAAPLAVDPGRQDFAAPSTAEQRLAVGAPQERSAYRELVERLAWRPGMPAPQDPADAAIEAARQEALVELDQQIAGLREVLTGERAPDAEGQAEGEGEALPPGAIDPKILELLRERGGRVSEFTKAGYDAYSTHMRRGQELLAAERYFDAEERFAAALNQRNADPMAAVGRLHAQIGASMFMSATINLRSLLTSNPELIGTRYAPELLPTEHRVREIMARLDELIAAGRGLPPDAGLLLAYLGYQTGDRTAIVRGLNAASVAARGSEESPRDERLDALVRVLRDVWLSPEAGAAKPPGAAPGAEQRSPAAAGGAEPGK